jgi:maltose O-acetyltransferase
MVIQGKKVGENAVVGAGCINIKDVEANTTVVGNPARVVKKG